MKFLQLIIETLLKKGLLAALALFFLATALFVLAFYSIITGEYKDNLPKDIPTEPTTILPSNCSRC